MRRFMAYLEKRPEDIGVRWLLNVAAMTLGEYPDKVPPKYLIPLGALPVSNRPGPVSQRRRPNRPRSRRKHGRRQHP